MLNVKMLADWAGYFTVLAGLIVMIIRPVYKSFMEINKSLTITSRTIELLRKDIEQSQTDRQLMHDILNNHEDRLDRHNDRLLIIETKEGIKKGSD